MIDAAVKAARDSGVCDTEPDYDSREDWLAATKFTACAAATVAAAFFGAAIKAGIIRF